MLASVASNGITGEAFRISARSASRPIAGEISSPRWVLLALAFALAAAAVVAATAAMLSAQPAPTAHAAAHAHVRAGVVQPRARSGP